MTLGQAGFAALVWSSVASVVLVFAYLLWIVLREGRGAEDSSAPVAEVEP